MEAMEAVVRAERELDGICRYVTTSLAVKSDGSAAAQQQRLAFSEAEEQTLEEKVSEGIAACERALADAHEWAQELHDPKQVQQTKTALAQHQQQLKNHVVGCRKALVAYRQRAKVERLERERSSLLTRSAAERPGEDGKVASGSAGDVTAALRRTRQVMSQEIERVSSVTKVLDDGRVSLRSSHEEYGGVNAEIAEVRKRLKALKWQAQQDRMWIGAGIAVLAATVLFIVYERTGFIFV